MFGALFNTHISLFYMRIDLYASINSNYITFFLLFLFWKNIEAIQIICENALSLSSLKLIRMSYAQDTRPRNQDGSLATGVPGIK